MERRVIWRRFWWLVAATAVVAVIGLLGRPALETAAERVPTPAIADADADDGDDDAPSTASDSAPVVATPFAPPDERPDSAPTSQPAPVAPANVRGSIVSPRVVLAAPPNAEPVCGVDPEACELLAYRVVADAARSMVTYSFDERLRPSCRPARDGSFALRLPAGLFRLVATESIGAREGRPAVLETWYTFVDVVDVDITIDLGAHRFSAVVTTGRVTDRNGQCLGGGSAGSGVESTGGGGATPEVTFSDVCNLPRGGRLPSAGLASVARVDAEGRFAFALTRDAGGRSGIALPGAITGRLYARASGALARVDGVLAGSHTELTLDPAADAARPRTVRLEIAGAATHVSVASGAFRRSRAVSRPAADNESVSVEWTLEPGRYTVDMTDDLASRWASAVILVATDDDRPVHITPMWQPARSVEGTAAPGTRVERVLVSQAGTVMSLQATTADVFGRFALRGLSPTGTLHVRVGGAAPLEIAADTGLVVVLP